MSAGRSPATAASRPVSESAISTRKCPVSGVIVGPSGRVRSSAEGGAGLSLVGQSVPLRTGADVLIGGGLADGRVKLPGVGEVDGAGVVGVGASVGRGVTFGVGEGVGLGVGVGVA